MTRSTRAITYVVPGEEYPSHLVEIYDYISRYVEETGYPPSIRELTGLDPNNSDTYQRGFASSTSVVRYYCDRMQRFGMIKVTPRISRGIRLIPRKDWKKYATAKPKVLRVKSA